MRKQTNFLVTDEGTVVLITPVSDKARQWVDENLSIEAWAWLGDSFGVEHRYAYDILEAISEEMGGVEAG
jgi:hypothetical protein